MKKIFFGNNLNFLINEKGFKKKNLAELAETSQSGIGNYINDNKLPNGLILVKFSELLGIGLDDLVYTDLSKQKNELIQKNENLGIVSESQIEYGNVTERLMFQKTIKALEGQADALNEALTSLKQQNAYLTERIERLTKTNR